MGDQDSPSDIPGDGPSEPTKSPNAQGHRRIPDSYTRIYPVRSLFSDVQPASEGPINRTAGPDGSFQFLNEALSNERTTRLRRTAQWQANMTEPSSLLPPGGRSLVAPGIGPLPFPSSDSETTSSPAHRSVPPIPFQQPHSSLDTSTGSGAHTELSDRYNFPAKIEPPTQARETGMVNISVRPPDSDTPHVGVSSESGSAAPFTSILASGGYVHLGPIRPFDIASERSGGSFKDRSAFSSTSINDTLNALPELPSTDSDSDKDGTNDHSGPQSSGPQSHLINSQAADSEANYSTRSEAYVFENLYKTSRFEHLEMEDGHFLLLGREGNLARCEDEPIRTPGAVQGFGVLVALEEDFDTGNLIVRQVSENCTEILGLTPQFLFNLNSFADILPSSQADVLWDNIQYLNEPERDSPLEGNSEDSPQVFMLSGYGQPGSIVQEMNDVNSECTSRDSGSQSSASVWTRSSLPSTNSMERRQWTCWCAAHRPKQSVLPPASAGDSSLSSPVPKPGLIILEFELEHDVYNPLYPALDLASPSNLPAATGGENADSSGVGGDDGRERIGANGGARQTSAGSGSTSVPISLTTAGHTSTVTPHSLDPSSASARPPLGVMRTVPDTSELAAGDEPILPPPKDVLESTTNRAKPIKALERMRRMERSTTERLAQNERPTRGSSKSSARRTFSAGSAGTLDVFAILEQVNEQLSTAPDLQSFLDITVGIVKDLTQFHRVLIYQFDESANGQVVAELADWSQTHDLYRGLHFPAGDIPAQARELYKINKVRSLYDRSQTTARLVGRSRVDVDTPLDLTHSYLRAMSPIHIKCGYLGNMEVRASMSISIVSFGQLWGLICCHSYGEYGMRVSFPVRQMLRLLSDSISRNVERLSYAQRLHTRKLINTIPTDAHPTGYIVSNAEDLLGLFDADFGVLVIGDGAKILGPSEHGQDILIVTEYLRLKQFKFMQVTQEISKHFDDIILPGGLNVIAGLLYIPLSSGGKDFIAFLRKGQLRDVSWAGRPSKGNDDGTTSLEPRSSFKAWSETVMGRCRAWTNEQLDTAGVLALVYGKFIEVWRQKESAVRTSQLTNLLLSNANHEVRTPLNHIINYLELALDGPLDNETRSNLSLSHTASKNLLFTINDLLDLARLESGNETSFNEPFEFSATIEEAVKVYRTEALRRSIDFTVNTAGLPKIVVGDSKKIRTVVANLTANAVKFTEKGLISVDCRRFDEPAGQRGNSRIIVEIIVGDTGCGIESSKLESIFREFEQVEQSPPSTGHNPPGLGLGLAVVARIVQQLGGQLRVDSKPDEGSRFSFLIPFSLPPSPSPTLVKASPALSMYSRTKSVSSISHAGSEINSLVEALSSNLLDPMTSHRMGEVAMDARTDPNSKKAESRKNRNRHRLPPAGGEMEIVDSNFPVRSVKVDSFDLDASPSPNKTEIWRATLRDADRPAPPPVRLAPRPAANKNTLLRVLIVEDEVVNRTVLQKRLTLDGHSVLSCTNGQEAVDLIQNDRGFDCILMDIQMPILNGFEASAKIRAMEKANPLPLDQIRLSTRLNEGIPIFAVSASLREAQRQYMMELGMDAWILKPIDFKRLSVLVSGVTDPSQRQKDVYTVGCNWEVGGWMREPKVSFSP